MAEVNTQPLEIAPVTTTVLNPALEIAQERERTKPQDTVNVLAEYYAAALDRKVNETRQSIESGMLPMLKNEADGKAGLREEQRLEGQIELAMQSGDTPQAALDRVRNATTFGGYVTPDIAVLTSDSEMGARERRQLDKVTAAERIIEERRSRSREGIVASGGYFVDYAVSTGLQNVLGTTLGWVGLGQDTFENATTLNELAAEINDLLVSDVTPKFFEEEFNRILDRAFDAGFFSESNPLFLETFLQNIQEGGTGQTAQQEKAFEVFDVATLGLVSAAKILSKPTSTSRGMSALKGKDKAVEVVTRAADEGGEASVITGGSKPAAQLASNPAEIFYSDSSLAARRALESENMAMDAVRNFEWGAIADERLLNAVKTKWVEEARARIATHSAHEINIDLLGDGFGNSFARVVLGKTDGTPYVSRASAQRLADKIGGEVKETVHAGVKKYEVWKEYNIDMTGLARSTNLNQIADGALTGALSTTHNTTAYLNGILKHGESVGAKALKEVSEDYKRVASQTSKVERDRVSGIFTSLQNDVEHSLRKEPLSRAEFADMYFKRYGETPSEQATAYYQSIRDIEYTDWNIMASELLRGAVANGETMVRLKDGVYYRAKNVKAPDGASVWDDNLGKFRRAEADEFVYAIKDFAYDGGAGFARYVAVKNPVERRLYQSDVLSYNVGGHRVYTDDIRFYIKQETEVTLGDGSSAPSKPLTFQGVRTEDEARKVTEEFNRIVQGIRDGLDDAELNRIVSENNTWNNNVENIKDFRQFADRHGLDPETFVDWAPDGQKLRGSQEFGEWIGAREYNELFRSSWNNRGRRPEPLIGMGGDKLETLNPIVAIQQGFGHAINRRANWNYNFNAINGLARTMNKLAAQGEIHVKNWGKIKDLPPEDLLREANGNFLDTKIGRKLQQETNTILRIKDQLDPADNVIQRGLQSVADFAYDKKQNLPRSTQAWIDELAKSDVVGFTRSAAFHTKLGLGTPDQLWVQSSQMFNATHIASANLGYVGAMRAASGVPALRAALLTSDDVARHIAARQASVTGITPDDFMELRQWMMDTGRTIIARTTVEENRIGGLSTGKFAGVDKSTLANLSTIAFNEGELTARLGAALLNVAEMRKAGIKGSFSDQATTRRMVHRQDVLTASMTRTSAAPWQRNMLSIPFQFQTYTVRMYEQLFTSNVLTPKERWRLALGHVAMYGAASIPLAGLGMDYLGFQGGVDPNNGFYHAARYGGLDAALSVLTNQMGAGDTAVSTRLGLGEGMTSFMRDLFSERAVDTAIGPGGEIIKDSVWLFGKAMYSLFNAPSDIAAHDWHKFARISSTYDDAYKLWIAHRYGQLITRKSGATQTDSLNTAEGLLLGMGVPLVEQSALWSLITSNNFDKRGYEKTLKRIQELQNVAGRAMQREDYEAAAEIYEEIAANLALFSPAEIDKAWDWLGRNTTITESVLSELIRRGKADVAVRYKELLEE